MLFHECVHSVGRVSFKEKLSAGFSGSMCGQPIYLARVVLTVIDFFPCLVFSSQKLWCLSNEAQTHSGLLQPSRLGEIWLIERRDSWKKSTVE